MLALVVVFVAFAGVFLAGGRAFASFADASGGAVQIVRPGVAALVGDGNLSLIEVTAIDRMDGVVDRVEIALDAEDQWHVAERLPDDATRWQHIWRDPATGAHRIRVRAFGVEDNPVVEQSTTVTVADTWSSTYIIDNPYAVRGAFRKGQLHMHSTGSFDAWNSLPAAQFALAYKARGYQFAVLTDHDVISDPHEVNDGGFIAIPGYESTTDSGHISGLFTAHTVSPSLRPQDRVDGIVNAGGLAVLNHPGWRVGWTGTDFTSLQGYTAIEIFNGATSDSQRGATANLAKWQAVLNAKGWSNRIWAVAVDDSHDTDQVDRGWIMAKTATLTPDAVKHAIRNGAFYASNGPSFRAIGVMSGAITASSADASVIRFFDQDGNMVLETPAAWGAYRPSGKERWIRVEAVMADGRTAWSQPFWLMPNAPQVSLSPGPRGLVVSGATLPGARVHISDRGQYLGSAVANDEGSFTYVARVLADGEHDLWIMATSPGPDQIDGPPTLLTWEPTSSIPAIQAIGRWMRGAENGRSGA